MGRISTPTVVWGVVFAIVHFFWAAGGEGGAGQETTEGVGVAIYIAFIGVLGLAGAAVAYGLGRFPAARIERMHLIGLARTGAIVLALGVVFGVGRWVADGSLGDDGASGVVITAYFALGSALFAALGWERQPAGARA